MKNFIKYIGFLLRDTNIGDYLNVNLSYIELERLGIRENEWSIICNTDEVLSAIPIENGVKIQLTRYPFTKIYNC